MAGAGEALAAAEAEKDLTGCLRGVVPGAAFGTGGVAPLPRPVRFKREPPPPADGIDPVPGVTGVGIAGGVPAAGEEITPGLFWFAGLEEATGAGGGGMREEEAVGEAPG